MERERDGDGSESVFADLQWDHTFIFLFLKEMMRERTSDGDQREV